jgi:hypothetical protein
MEVDLIMKRSLFINVVLLYDVQHTPFIGDVQERHTVLDRLPRVMIVYEMFCEAGLLVTK